MDDLWFDILSKEQIESKVPGHSGASRIGLTPIPNIAADELQGAFEELAAYLKPVETKREERLYQPAAFPDYSVAGVEGWNRLPNPKISIPALGASPLGTAWRVDVIGNVRVTPPVAGHVLSGVSLDGTTPGVPGVAGGGYLTTYGFGNMPVMAIGLVPPSINSPFMASFHVNTGTSGAGAYAVKNMAVTARAYLVKG